MTQLCDGGLRIFMLAVTRAWLIPSEGSKILIFLGTGPPECYKHMYKGNHLLALFSKK